MKTLSASTSNVNDNSIAMLTNNTLTFKVNKYMSDDIENVFGKWLKNYIEALPFSQIKVAKEADISEVQLSRIVTGVSGVKRDTAENIIDAINKLAGKELANKTEGLALAGFAPRIADFDNLVIPLKGLDREDVEEISMFVKFRKYRKNFQIDYEDMPKAFDVKIKSNSESKPEIVSAGSSSKSTRVKHSEDQDMGLQFSGGKRKTSKQNEDELNRQMDEAIDKVKKNKK